MNPRQDRLLRFATGPSRPAQGQRLSQEDEQAISHNVTTVLNEPQRRYGPGNLDAISVIQEAIAGFQRDIRNHRPPLGKRMTGWGKQATTEAAHKIVLYQEAIRRLEAAGLKAERPWVEGEPPLLLLRFRELEASARTALGGKPTRRIVFLHSLALFHAPAYLAENADGIRQDWPRVPLPDSKKLLLASAELGRQVAALLDTEAPVPGVNDGKVRPELKFIADLGFTGEMDLRVTAGWGHAGKGGVTMPGKGKLLTRGYHPEEAAAFGVGPASRLSPSQSGMLETGATPVLSLLGHATHDIYLNDTAYWRNVPERVWDFTIGGYQVLKKWLSYREHALLGRPLTIDEAREVTHTARRLAALILLQPELDANYQQTKAACHSWPA